MLWHLFKNNKNEFFALFLFVLLLIICKFIKIDCIIYKVTGIHCPTCNMTRAILALTKGDINTYVELNVMAAPVLVSYLGELFIKVTSRYKKTFDIYAISILIINFVYYANRVF